MIFLHIKYEGDDSCALTDPDHRVHTCEGYMWVERMQRKVTHILVCDGQQKQGRARFCLRSGVFEVQKTIPISPDDRIESLAIRVDRLSKLRFFAITSIEDQNAGGLRLGQPRTYYEHHEYNSYELKPIELSLSLEGVSSVRGWQYEVCVSPKELSGVVPSFEAIWRLVHATPPTDFSCTTTLDTTDADWELNREIDRLVKEEAGRVQARQWALMLKEASTLTAIDEIRKESTLASDKQRARQEIRNRYFQANKFMPAGSPGNPGA
ncbi:MAG: hypothetical protein KGR16_03075 [Verrucomicrobia bacterium]|nr:hypothetical protein [Verrucomicrobiota bacterium]